MDVGTAIAQDDSCSFLSMTVASCHSVPGVLGCHLRAVFSALGAFSRLLLKPVVTVT